MISVIALARGDLLAVAEWFLALGVGGALLAALLWSLPSSPRRKAYARQVLGIALMLYTSGLVVQAAGAQWAWGAFWSWDPVECWRLTGWLALAIAALGLGRLGWWGARVTWALWLTGALGLFVLFGAVPLVRMLGLDSLYLMG